MNTITLTPEVYNDVKAYAVEKHQSVEEFVIALIRTALAKAVNKRKGYKMKKTEELSPILREILNMPKIGKLDADDINGDKAREEYLEEYKP